MEDDFPYSLREYPTNLLPEKEQRTLPLTSHELPTENKRKQMQEELFR